MQPGSIPDPFLCHDADPDPDPAKWYGSDRIRIQNTGFQSDHYFTKIPMIMAD